MQVPVQIEEEPMAFDVAAAVTLGLCAVFGAGYIFKAIDRRVRGSGD
jgi:hypothetical protein